MTITLEQLRQFTVARNFFEPTTLKRALHKMKFVQADPIRSPARAQDLILRHRVKDYRAGDLERRYAELDIEEDFFVIYGFVTSSLHSLMHPRSSTGVPSDDSGRRWPVKQRRRAELLLEFVRARGEVHPREVDEHFSHGKVTNYWGGSSNATTHLMDAMHYAGMLRVVGREKGIRIYAVRENEAGIGTSGKAESRGNELTGGKAESRGNEHTGGKAEARGNELMGGRPESRGNGPTGGTPVPRGNEHTGGKPESRGNGPTGGTPVPRGKGLTGGRPESRGNELTGGKAESRGNGLTGGKLESRGNGPTGGTPVPRGKGLTGGTPVPRGKGLTGGTPVPRLMTRVDELVDVVVRIYAPLPASSLAYYVRRLRYAAPQWRDELPNALQRAKERLAQTKVEGISWYWPENENAAKNSVIDRVRLLAPFDPVVHDRTRFELLWNWVYRFEAYTPAAKRKLGYYAMPLLWRDRIIGWANLSLKHGELIPEFGYVASNPPRDRTFRIELEAELDRIRTFLGLNS